MKKILIIGLLLMIVMPFVLAEDQDSIGTFKKGECIQLIQNCNCSYVNFTSVYNPDMVLLLSDVTAEKKTSDFNYTFCSTGMVGRYLVNGIGDVNGVDKVFAYDFYITTEGLAFSNYVVLLIILIFGYLILSLGIWKEEIVMVTLGSMVIIILGIYIQINGISDMKNWITNAFGIINWGIGAYILVRAYGEEAMRLLGN